MDKRTLAATVVVIFTLVCILGFGPFARASTPRRPARPSRFAPSSDGGAITLPPAASGAVSLVGVHPPLPHLHALGAHLASTASLPETTGVAEATLSPVTTEPASSAAPAAATVPESAGLDQQTTLAVAEIPTTTGAATPTPSEPPAPTHVSRGGVALVWDPTVGKERRVIDLPGVAHGMPVQRSVALDVTNMTAAALRSRLGDRVVKGATLWRDIMAARASLRCPTAWPTSAEHLASQGSEENVTEASSETTRPAPPDGTAERIQRCPPLEDGERFRYVAPHARGRDHSQYGQAHVLARLFPENNATHDRQRFFIEAGSNDGVTHSNSAIFEFQRNWNGLLVEADPSLYRMTALRRSVFTLPGCLSSSPRSLKFDPVDSAGLGMIRQTGTVRVTCHRITDLLLALGRTHVDFFSLDVEGHEVEVLRGLDPALVTVDVIMAEYMEPNAWAHPKNAANLRAIREVLEPKGYALAALLPEGCQWQRTCLDALFIRKASGVELPGAPPVTFAPGSSETTQHV